MSRCDLLAQEDTELPDAEREKAARTYTDKALELLRESIKRGFEDYGQLEDDPDIKPLRQRQDFQAHRSLTRTAVSIRPRMI